LFCGYGIGFSFLCSSFACPKEEPRKGQKKRCFHAQADPIPTVFFCQRAAEDLEE